MKNSLLQFSFCACRMMCVQCTVSPYLGTCIIVKQPMLVFKSTNDRYVPPAVDERQRRGGPQYVLSNGPQEISRNKSQSHSLYLQSPLGVLTAYRCFTAH